MVKCRHRFFRSDLEDHRRSLDRTKVWHQAFKSYDEAGAARRIQCLKYLVLATMLMESAVDPFTAQESQPYKNDPEVSFL